VGSGGKRSVVRFLKERRRLAISIIGSEAEAEVYAAIADKIRQRIYVLGTDKIAATHRFGRYVHL